MRIFMPLMVKLSFLFTGTLIFGRKSKSSLKLAFLIYFGGAFAMVLLNPVFGVFMDVNLFKSLNFIFLNLIGLLFLNFIYVLFDKKKNLSYYCFVCIPFLLLTFHFHNYLPYLNPGETTRNFFALNFTLTTFPSLLGLHILFNKTRKINDKNLKKQIIGTVVGFFLILIIALLSNLLFSNKTENLVSNSIVGVAFSTIIFLVAGKLYLVTEEITKKHSSNHSSHSSVAEFLKPADGIKSNTISITNEKEKEIRLLLALNRIYSFLLTFSNDDLVITEILKVLQEVTAAKRIKIYGPIFRETGNYEDIRCFEWNDEQNVNPKFLSNWWENRRFSKVWKQWYSSLTMGKVILGRKDKTLGIRFGEYDTEKFGSILIVPIKCEETLLGFMSFTANSQGKFWPEEMKQMLLLVASLIGRLLIDKRFKESLWEKRERYRAILENIFDLTCEISEEGNLLYISPNISKVTGFLDTELIDKSYFALIYEEDRPQVLVNFEKTIKQRHVMEIIYRIKRKDGELCWLKSMGKLYKTPTSDQRWILVSSLITDPVNLEEKIVEVNKKEIISILSESIANKFKDVLGIIFKEIREVRMLFSSESRVFIKLLKAEKALERAEELTQQLMTLANRSKPETEALFMDQLIIDLLNPLLCGTKISFQLENQKELWPIEADNEQIKQVFSNIIINAVQAMSEGGQIKIVINNQIIDEEMNIPLASGKYVKVQIVDSGVGINSEDLRRIFEPCFTTKLSGTGLGLTISYSIVKKYGGHIQVFSRIGKGTEFTIFLPAKTEESRGEYAFKTSCL
jgi:PAS domain S-box-containing protein